MNDTAQLESSEKVTATTPQQGAIDAGDQPKVAGYKVIPSANGDSNNELFQFRARIATPAPEPQEPEKGKHLGVLNLVLLVGVLAVAAALLFGMGSLTMSKPPAPYIDMGNQRLDAAGLGGRFIARWEGSAAFQLYLDPLDPQQAAGFQAVAEDPPHALSIVIRLRDPSGKVACQKAIAFPDLAEPENPADHEQALRPRTTATGDTIQNMAGADGQIDEITVSGALPCTLTAYQHLAGWDFTTNFPNVAGQQDWLMHVNALVTRIRPHAAGWLGPSLHVERLASPIEGDDVVVGDNPSRGTMDTSGGFTFMIGANAMRARAPEWQVFPASIHFHCERNGACILTRNGSHNDLQARLMR